MRHLHKKYSHKQLYSGNKKYLFMPFFFYLLNRLKIFTLFLLHYVAFLVLLSVNLTQYFLKIRLCEKYYKLLMSLAYHIIHRNIFTIFTHCSKVKITCANRNIAQDSRSINQAMFISH